MESTLFYNATIHTQSLKRKLASTMLVEGSKIVAVGGAEIKSKSANTHEVDLKGKTLLPGFNDAHIHVWKVGQLESFIIDLRGVKSIKTLQEKVKKQALLLPAGNWVVGRGFNEQLLEDKRMPVKEDLDAVSTDHPIYIIRTCAHIAVANSNALQKAKVDAATSAPQGGVIGKTANGLLTGIFYETAIGLIAKHIPQPTADDYKQMILMGAKKLLSYGVTSATDPAVHPELLNAYRELDQHNETLIRFNLMPILLPDGGDKAFPIPEKWDSEFMRVDTLKFFADGGLSGKTAALKRFYKNSKDKGVLRLQYDNYLSMAREAQHKGFRIGTHAIGDEAIEMVLEVYKTLYKEFGNTRNRIEHFGLPSQKNIDDVATYGFLPIPQAIFLHELGENFVSALDEGYLQQCYPIRGLLKKHISVAFSTDAPVVGNINPWSGIKTAINRESNLGYKIGPQESITVEEAIYAYTMGSAFAEGNENIKGSIEPNKVADFITLDKDPLKIPTEELDTIKVEATYVNGKCLYQRSSTLKQ